MARITVEDCLSRIGNANRFSLVHLGVARIKQHRKGQPYLAKGKNKETVMTLREIANGSVTFDNINTLGQPPLEEKEEDVTEVSEETAN
jgi:DNA-directed RNA polymerase subunit omega